MKFTKILHSAAQSFSKSKLLYSEQMTGKLDAFSTKLSGKHYSTFYSSVMDDLNRNTGYKKSQTEENGDIVRSAYHLTCENINQQVKSGSYNYFFQNKLTVNAYFIWKLRESIRMQAWEHMDPIAVVSLKNRNLTEYGREEGPDFIQALQQKQKRHPDATEDEILKIIIAEGLEKTSDDYDAVYGVVQVPIEINNKGGVEANSSLLEKVEQKNIQQKPIAEQKIQALDNLNHAKKEEKKAKLEYEKIKDGGDPIAKQNCLKQYLNAQKSTKTAKDTFESLKKESTEQNHHTLKR